MSLPVKEHPIIFSTKLIPAILNNEKTVTRRVIKDKWKPQIDREYLYANKARIANLCPYGQVGDRLWVRENLIIQPGNSARYSDGQWIDGKPSSYNFSYYTKRGYRRKTIASIHMPRWASRITLEIIDIRIERLQDISWSDIQKEGIIDYLDYSTKRELLPSFIELWNSIHKKEYTWEDNPWVWVIVFKKLILCELKN
ncbi:MAG: hypothetical protein ACFFG0_56845 [Candidatus Thorarchaeota archaeon]